MREIKFRGIKKGKTDFVYGSLVKKFDMVFIVVYLPETNRYADV